MLALRSRPELKLVTISVKEVLAAYRDFNLFPVQGTFFNFQSKCELEVCGACAVGALYISKHFPKRNYQVRFTYWELAGRAAARRWADRHYGVPYVDGFVRGFDYQVWDSRELSDRARLGWLHGKRCREALGL